jgi:hypothetical protein
MQYVTSKHWYLPSSSHDITTQKTNNVDINQVSVCLFVYQQLLSLKRQYIYVPCLYGARPRTT